MHEGEEGKWIPVPGTPETAFTITKISCVNIKQVAVEKQCIHLGFWVPGRGFFFPLAIIGLFHTSLNPTTYFVSTERTSKSNTRAWCGQRQKAGLGFSGALLSALHLPVCSRYAMLTSSTGKKAAVAPYSGHMLAIVARSAMDSWATPGPKNSTNLPTTPTCRRCYTTETIGKLEA